MWFDARAALALVEGGARPAPKEFNGLDSQNSQDSQRPAAQSRDPTTRPAPAEFTGHATPQRTNEDFAQYAREVRSDLDADTFQHGASVAGKPLTWTGRIVSLDDWRRLTEWERHGPKGRHWNGITRRWELP